MKMSILFIISEQARYSKEMTCIAYGNFRSRDLTCVKNNILSPSFSAFLRCALKCASDATHNFGLHSCQVGVDAMEIEESK